MKTINMIVDAYVNNMKTGLVPLTLTVRKGMNGTRYYSGMYEEHYTELRTYWQERLQKQHEETTK